PVPWRSFTGRLWSSAERQRSAAAHNVASVLLVHCCVFRSSSVGSQPAARWYDERIDSVRTMARTFLGRLTFDMRGRRRPQAGGGPLDGRVYARHGRELTGCKSPVGGSPS